jgi:hypothetical protein
VNVHELTGKFGYHARLLGTVAQLVEQGPFKALVLGSSPSRPTNKNNDLRNNPPAETVRTEICTETFEGHGFKSNRRTKFASLEATGDLIRSGIKTIIIGTGFLLAVLGAEGPRSARCRYSCWQYSRPSNEKSHNPIVYSIAIWLVVALCLLVWPFIARRSTELAITDKRLIAKYGVISTQSIEIRFHKIETVRVKQGLFGRMFNYGDIVVTGTGSTFDPIRNIANAKIFRNALNQAMEAVSPPVNPAAAAA